MREGVVSDKRDREHIYRLRSCLNCTEWCFCIVGIRRRSNCKINFAAFGCRNYLGEHENELPMTPQEKIRYIRKEI